MDPKSLWQYPCRQFWSTHFAVAAAVNPSRSSPKNSAHAVSSDNGIAPGGILKFADTATKLRCPHPVRDRRPPDNRGFILARACHKDFWFAAYVPRYSDRNTDRN